MARIPAPLLFITDRSQTRKPLVDVIEAAFVGGCRWLSLREKDLPSDERVALVHAILPMARKFGATFLVHGDMRSALLADGVHLPSGANIAEARVCLGNDAWIGLSCHTLPDVAASTGADYVTLGPFAPTASKPGRMPVLGPEALRDAAANGAAVLALGGVDETNLAIWKRAGASGISVMGGVMRSADPGGYVRRIIEAWEEA